MPTITIHQITLLAEQLSAEEQLQLVERLARSLRQRSRTRRTPRDLYGVWRELFPAEFDLDAALREIRSDWQREEGS